MFGLLAPLPQSIREMEAVLLYPALSDFIPQGDRINEITKVKDGYLVITTNRVIKAKITYKKPTTIGPKKFSIQFTELKN